MNQHLIERLHVYVPHKRVNDRKDVWQLAMNHYRLNVIHEYSRCINTN